jgi:hypothetical protein
VLGRFQKTGDGLRAEIVAALCSEQLQHASNRAKLLLPLLCRLLPRDLEMRTTEKFDFEKIFVNQVSELLGSFVVAAKCFNPG